MGGAFRGVASLDSHDGAEFEVLDLKRPEIRDLGALYERLSRSKK